MNMFKRKNGVLAFLLVAVMLLGVGFAALSDDLIINGTATATIATDGSDADKLFEENIYFTGSESADKATDTTGTYNNTDTVSFTATEFDKKGDTATITYTIKNSHPDLSASVSVPTIAVDGADKAYFTCESDWGADAKVIAAGGEQDVKVTVTLARSTIKDLTASVKLTFVATAVAP